MRRFGNYWKKSKVKNSELSVQGLLEYIAFQENPINNRDKRLHPYISEALQLLFDHSIKERNMIEEVNHSREDHGLGVILDKHGSDKNSRHSYAFVYAELINKYQELSLIEIGLGSTNGFPYGGLKPGGSMKAWREFSPNSLLVGIDIDIEAVNEIDEHGFVMDQTSSESIDSAFKGLIALQPKFNLIIDDGFHDPHANIRTYLSFYNLLLDDGTYVIEDVHSSLIPFWTLLALSLPGKMKVIDLSALRKETDDNFLILFTR